MMQRPTQRLLPKFLRDLNPNVIGLSPSVEVVIFFCRYCEMTALYSHIAMQARQHLGILQLVAPILLQLLQQEFLRIVMLRESARGAGYFHWSGSVPARVSATTAGHRE